ncbi:MAG TPA: hypothetical protein VG275_09615, partial [Solirubrobacteraceae bacterium]|nr:hypothetical protein [Solirubrobacteraceae bacterium]
MAVLDRVRRARWRLLIAAALMAVLAGSPAVAHAASLSWSGPVSLDTAGGGEHLTSVACPSPSQCTAVDDVGQ